MWLSGSTRTQMGLFAAAFLAAALFVGCSKTPPTPAPGNQGPGSEKPISWDMKERFNLDTGLTHDGKPIGMLTIAVSADGKLVLGVALGKKDNVQVWDLENRKKLYQYDTEVGVVLPVAISPDRKSGAYVTGGQSRVVLIDLTNGKPLRQLRKKDGFALGSFTTGLAFSPKGDLLIIAAEKEIVGWDPATGDVRFVWQEPEDVMGCRAFLTRARRSPRAPGRAIKVWDVATGNVAKTIAEKGEKEVDHLFVSADGKYLGLHESFGPIKMYDLKTGQVVKEFRVHPGTFCSSMQLLPDNRTIAYNEDWALVLQDTVTGEKKSFAEGREMHNGRWRSHRTGRRSSPPRITAR